MSEWRWSNLNLSNSFLNLMTIVLGIVAAYFLTIQSLKVELAAKAEAAVVAALDRKLAGFEVILREGVVGREQFYEFSKEVEARLARIEYHVSKQAKSDPEHRAIFPHGE